MPEADQVQSLHRELGWQRRPVLVWLDDDRPQLSIITPVQSIPEAGSNA
jgi:hypothetical protein